MINFDVIQRRNPKDGTVKFYSQVYTSEYMTLDDIAENISRECTVTVHDIKAVLSALEEQIIIALQAGRSVRFGDLGSFHVTLKSKGTDTKEEFTTANIERVMVRFVRSSKMRSDLMIGHKNVKFKAVGNSGDTQTGEPGTGEDADA